MPAMMEKYHTHLIIKCPFCQQRRAFGKEEKEMFNNNKKRQVVAMVLAVILILAMVLPLALSGFGGLF